MLIKCLAELEDFKSISNEVKYVYITSNGDLISHKTTKGNYREKPKIIKGTLNKDGYIRDDFYRKRDKKGFKIFRHQLVMLAFSDYKLGYYNLGKEIDHINRTRTDNRLSNLRIVSRQQNIDNSCKARIKSRLFSKEDILEIYRLKFKEKLKYCEIANIFNVKYPTIISICKGQTYKEIHAEEIANFC